MKTIFTDGSVLGNPGPGGWAWACKETQETGFGSVEGPTTNNYMELTAILEALSRCPDEETVVICTDSKNALNWLTGRYKINEKHIKDIVHAALILRDSKRLSVTFRLIKGHSGDELNEAVDRLANTAAREAQKSATRKWKPDVQISEDPTEQIGLMLTLEWAGQEQLQAMLKALDGMGVVARGKAALNKGGRVTNVDIEDNVIR